MPITIRTMSSPSSSLYNNYSQSTTSSSQGSTATCAYPSWPTGNSLGYKQNSPSSSYISDADLFGDDCDDEFNAPLLQEAPAPPRVPPMAQAFPILPPLYVKEKPKQQRRRSSGRKPRRTSKPMSPIAESVEAAE